MTASGRRKHPPRPRHGRHDTPRPGPVPSQTVDAGDFDAAEHTFRRMLCLCPEDGIGARMLLAAVRARKLWDDFGVDHDNPF